jgi:hypothetical protein
MAAFFDRLEPEHTEFIERQLLFFTASAATTGRLNISPKGMDAFRVLSPNSAGYLDVTGSASETSAHLLDDNRLTFMFCSFGPEPLILRLYGSGRAIQLSSEEGQAMVPTFGGSENELLPGARQLIMMDITSVQTSCGFGVPMFEEGTERQQLRKWANAKVRMGQLEQYWKDRNSTSIDGLPTGIG